MTTPIRTLPPVALTLALLVTLAATAATAGGDARATGMAGAQTAVARGVDAAAWNPAALAFSPGVSMGLAGVALDLHNNSFTLGRYNEVSGATLSEADKERLLADIPAGGFRLDAAASAGALGVQIGRFALTSGATAAGRGNLDRDFFDLVLFGNELGQTVDFADTWGEGFAVGELALSWGQPVYEGSLGRLAVGASVAYLQGLYEMHVEESYGSVTTGMTEIAGEAYVAAVTSDGGSGYGLDLAAAWQAPGGWSLGLALDNALGQLEWTGTTERTELRVTATEINALNDDLEDAVADSDTTYAVGGYQTDLPRRLRLGAAHDGGTLLLAADYVQGLDDRAGASTTPQLNLGAEWRPFGWLTPRAGLSLGGAAGVGVAGGLGLDLAFWQLDVAVLHRGGFRGDDTRGLGGAVSTRWRF
jgi:hypothetical protein